MDESLNGYKLTREWFNWCFENPEKVKPIHTALYIFIVDHCNRMGWKEKFGLPSYHAMEALGIKNWRTYKGALDDLVKFKAIKLISESKNQYTATVIAIVDNTKAPTKALDKATSKHCTKQLQGTAVIDKLKNLETNKLTNTNGLDNLLPSIEFQEFFKSYPKRECISDAQETWNAVVRNDPDIIEKIKVAVEWQKKTGCLKEVQYAPKAHVWLQGKRWLDENTVTTGVRRRCM